MKNTLKRKKMQKSSKGDRIAFRMAIISSRGQVTVPQDIRAFMHIKKGTVIGFEPTRYGVLMKAMKVEPEDPYTEEEWNKIEKLAKGKVKHIAAQKRPKST